MFDFSQSLGNEGYYSPRLTMIYVTFHTCPSLLFLSTHPLLTPSLVLFPQRSAYVVRDVFTFLFIMNR